MKRGFSFLVLLALTLTCSPAAVSPRVFSVSPGVLPKMKVRLATIDASLIPAFRKLTNDANRAASEIHS